MVADSTGTGTGRDGGGQQTDLKAEKEGDVVVEGKKGERY